MKTKKLLTLHFAVSLPGSMFASVLVNQTVVNIHGSGRIPGQSFTTLNDGSWNFLTEVDFGKGYTSIPSGSLFLLSQPYIGNPQDLSISTPGYLAMSDATTSGTGFYADFLFTGANQFAMAPNTQYWVYGNSSTGWDLNWTDHVAYSGGYLYMALPTGIPFGASSPADYQFTVDTQAVPEPSTGWLLGAGLATVTLISRRREKAGLV